MHKIISYGKIVRLGGLTIITNYFDRYGCVDVHQRLRSYVTMVLCIQINIININIAIAIIIVVIIIKAFQSIVQSAADRFLKNAEWLWIVSVAHWHSARSA